MDRESRIAMELQFEVIEDAIDAHLNEAHPGEGYLFRNCPECMRLAERENAFLDERARVEKL
jgi:hypothetical protein